jgi:pimeloyl-ACP methyl ester carboxylesterase/streptogramin lyase
MDPRTPRRPRPWRRWLASLACAFAIVPAPGGSAWAKGAPLLLVDCQVPGTKVAGKCGTVVVPEDRAKPGGRRLPLRVLVLPAVEARALEPVYVLLGGPGQAATEDADGWDTSPVRRRHAIVLMDLRGTGVGTALDCPTRADLDLQEVVEPLFHDPASFAACAATLAKSADLSLYTTPIAMQDLDDLRQALGHERIDLWAGSYGTRAALVYMRMFGGHVRSAVLSGILPLEDRAPLYHAAAAEEALERLFAQCAADAACHAAYPDPLQDVRTVLAGLAVRPARLSVSHPVTKAPSELTLTAAGFADGLRVMLYSVEQGRSLPRLAAEARAGHLEAFAQAAVQSGWNFNREARLGLLLSVTCSEDVARIRPDDIPRETAGTLFGDTRVRNQVAACAQWPRGRLPADYATPFETHVPTLLFSGTLDPVTPPHWGELALRTFVAGRHVVLPGAHVPDSPCVAAMTARMFDTASVQAVDARCVDALSLPPFELPGGSPSAPAVAQSPFADLKPVSLVHVGATADWVLATPDAVWTGSTGPHAVHRIDPRSNRLAASVPLPGEPCAGLAVGFGFLWVPLCGDKPGLAQVDLKTDRLQRVLPFPPAAEEGGVATSADSVWIVTDKQGSLARIDPGTGQLRQTVHLPAGSYNLRSADGILYATRVEGAALAVVDAATGEMLATVPTGPNPRFLTVGDGFVWTLNQGDGTLTRISVRTREAEATTALHTPGQGGDIAYHQGIVWTTMPKTPLSATDAVTGRVLHQWVGPGGDSLAVGHGALWITDYHAGTIARIPLEETGIR